MIHDKNNYCRKADQELVFLTTSDPSNNYHGPQPRDRNPKNQPPSAGNKKLRGNHVQEGQKSTAPPKINTSSRRVITHSIVSFQDSALPSFYPLMKESTGIKGYFDFIIGCTTHGTGWMACQDRKTIMSNRIIGLGDPFDSLAPPPLLFNDALIPCHVVVPLYGLSMTKRPGFHSFHGFPLALDDFSPRTS